MDLCFYCLVKFLGQCLLKFCFWPFSASLPLELHFHGCQTFPPCDAFLTLLHIFSVFSSLWSIFLQDCFPHSLPSSAVFTLEPDSAFFIVIILYFISSFFLFIAFKKISVIYLCHLLDINHSYSNSLSDNSKNPDHLRGYYYCLQFVPWFSFLWSYLLGLLTIYG